MPACVSDNLRHLLSLFGRGRAGPTNKSMRACPVRGRSCRAIENVARAGDVAAEKEYAGDDEMAGRGIIH